MKTFTIIAATMLGMMMLLFAQSSEPVASPSETPAAKHAPMEWFGMGPEMWQDRSVTWVKAVSAFLKEIISELGIIAMAVLLLVQNLKQKTREKENKEEVTRRLNDHGRRMTEIALAVQPTGAPIHKVEEPEVIAPG